MSLKIGLSYDGFKELDIFMILDQIKTYNNLQGDDEGEREATQDDIDMF